MKADGREDRKKARLVVNGNSQRKGVDYEETFAPVAKMVTVRALLVVAAMKNSEVCQMDVSNTFLIVICLRRYICSYLWAILVRGSLFNM